MNKEMPSKLYVVSYEADCFTHCGNTSLKECMSMSVRGGVVVVGVYELKKVVYAQSRYAKQTRLVKNADEPEWEEE